VRLALGASRGRLTTPLLAESLTLALSGGMFGILVAAWVVRGADNIPGLELPRVGEIHLDGTVLLFAIVLSIATGVLFGLAPSRLGFRTDIMNVLRGGDELPISRGQQGLSPFVTSSKNLLVVFQVALSTVLLIGAVLLIESVAHLQRVDLGFDAQNLLTMRLTLPAWHSDPAPGTGSRFDEIIERVEAIPGVSSGAVTLTLPATGFVGTPVWPVNQAPPPLNKRPIAVLQAITPGYFRTLGIGLRGGRDFAASDSVSSPKVVIVNESLARKFWPGYPREDPIGQSVLAGASPDPLRIVGIVSDVRQAGPAEDAQSGIYRPRTQVPPMSAMFAVRTKGDALRIVNAIRAEIAAVDRSVSIAAVKTMTDVLGESDGQRRGVMILVGLFASTGLIFASVGIYGVVGWSVTTRTREFGIRKALGAGHADVLKLVLGQGLKLTLAGSVLGLCAAAVLTRLLEGLLFEVSATDPAIFCGVAFCALELP
jgi:putative ABC transport system permease protein